MKYTTTLVLMLLSSLSYALTMTNDDIQELNKMYNQSVGVKVQVNKNMEVTVARMQLALNRFNNKLTFKVDYLTNATRFDDFVVEPIAIPLCDKFTPHVPNIDNVDAIDISVRFINYDNANINRTLIYNCGN